MYMRGGMRGYRRGRGLGQEPILNCPGDPGCPGYPGNVDMNPMIGTPLTPAQIAAMSAGNAAYFQPSATSTTGQTFSSWLNANAMTAIIGTAVFLIAWKAIGK